MADEYKQFTTELLTRVDIVDVVGSRIDLKKAGREHHACCPFHNEKTPSFTVSPQKQFYYCFGCHAKGDAITFVMQFDKLPFLEACEKLAHSVGLTPPNYQKKPSIDRSLYKLLRDYTITTKNDLQNNPEMQSYISQRGIPFSVQKDFHLGYSGPESARFIQNKLRDKESTNNLRECGLLSERDHKLQAKFYKRILFPIQDTQGRIIAFGGRVTEPERQPKYLNSPETILFKKRQVLYGLYQLSKSVHELVYVVEGYMDVLALNSQDIKNSVACLGTAFTPQHWKLITRYTDKIHFCFDGDKAGMRAAWLTLTNILPALTPEKNAYFMFMPPGEDPDSFCQKSGRSAFIDLSQQAQSWDVFFIDQLQSRYDLKTVSGKAGLLDEAKKHISSPDHPADQQITPTSHHQQTR